MMRCISCKDKYQPSEAGTCKECYEEASETEEELKREIEELKAKVSFLTCSSPVHHDHHLHRPSSSSSSVLHFTDVLLQAIDDDFCVNGTPSLPAHKAVLEIENSMWRECWIAGNYLMIFIPHKAGETFYLSVVTCCREDDVDLPGACLKLFSETPLGIGDALNLTVSKYRKQSSPYRASRSPVFRAMLESEMEESRSGTIKIGDVSYNVLRSFVQYLYTAEVSLNDHMAYDLLVLAEKYQVKHLKSYCEKFMASKVNGDTALSNFAFASRYNAKHLLEASLSLVMENMDKLTKQDEYKELVEKDPHLVVSIYEAYLTKQVNTAASQAEPESP